MTQTLEERFAQKWLANCDKMEALGIPTANIRKLQETHGALAAARKMLQGNRTSLGFEDLEGAGRLDLTLEYLAVSQEFGGLFTDAEANEALARLCEAGYGFGSSR